MDSEQTYRPKVLIADDVLENRELLRETIELLGYDAFLVPSGEIAVKVAHKVRPDLILLDIRMPGELDGFGACSALKGDPATREIPVIFITVDDEPESVVDAFQRGAVDYIVKPFSKDEVIARVRTHVSLFRVTRELQEKNRALQEEVERRVTAEEARAKAEEALMNADERLSFLSEQEASRWGIDGFVGRSDTVRAILEKVEKLQKAATISVLINGESGTGKELIARAIHFGGGRSNGPFVALNCSAIPRELAESTLFGHVKGSFSGAIQNRKGYFEMADGGTLFLDEIGELPLELQAKLLRALEERTFVPVGETAPRTVDIRIVAATNRDLGSMIQTGGFREDLYFRLARFTVEIPPLRDRKDDIRPLVQHFVALFAGEMRIPEPKISVEAMERMMDYSFPGNIRELKNVIERAVIEADGAIIMPGDLHFLKPRAARPGVAELMDRAEETAQQASRGSGGVAVAVPAPVSVPLGAALSPEEDKILSYVRENSYLTNSTCRELLEVNMDRAYYLLNKLQKAGLLNRVGGHRGAKYILAHVEGAG